MSDKMCSEFDKNMKKKKFEKYKEKAKDAKYVCKKCGRASNDKSCLCKADKI